MKLYILVKEGFDCISKILYASFSINDCMSLIPKDAEFHKYHMKEDYHAVGGGYYQNEKESYPPTFCIYEYDLLDKYNHIYFECIGDWFDEYAFEASKFKLVGEKSNSPFSIELPLDKHIEIPIE